MKHGPGLAVLAAVLALVPATAAPAADMKSVLTIDPDHPGALYKMFSVYGQRSRQVFTPEATGVRIRLPGTANVTQTGVYSFFALGGDCEVTLTYELLGVDTPQKGYGAGLGLAFDAGDDVGRAAIQRVTKPGKEGTGYVLERTLAGAKDKSPDDYRFVQAKTKKGRMGLRREGKEVVFLTADGPKADFEEAGRLPFTDRMIRVVRLFADDGGSPTVVDVRARDVSIRAEEITGGVSEREQRRSPWVWLWLAVPASGAGLLLWYWRARRRQDDDEPAAPARRRRQKA
jgi:hypothetical protein